jgi:fatty acid-binding protein DegV
VVENSFFITGTEPMWIWTKKLAKRTDKVATGNKRMGIQVVSRVTHTLSRQGKILATETRKSLYTKKIGYSIRGGSARSGSSRLCGYIQVTENLLKVKALQWAENGSLWLSKKARPQKRKVLRQGKDDISQSNGQRKLEQRTISVPKESNS